MIYSIIHTIKLRNKNYWKSNPHSIKDIKKGEEITWDYSTTMDEDKWEMDCVCQSKNCRKRIKDFKYLPKEIQQKYIKLGIVPDYILENLKRNPE